MYRWESKGMVVRYDGTETRIWVERAHERDGVTLAELDKLIEILGHAAAHRRAFEASLQSSEGDQ